MARKRRRLVPREGVEIFEIRISLFFDAEGARRVVCVVSTPEDADLETVDLVELYGALEYGTRELQAIYGGE